MNDEAALTTRQKAAMVVIAMGADKASKLYKYLNENELEQLTLEIAKIKHATNDQTENALDDFYRMCITQKVVSEGGLEYARAILEKAFGQQTANSLLDRISRSLRTRAFEFMRKSDSKNLFALIQHERPQMVAMILSYARSDQAADVIQELPMKKRIPVIEAIAKMDRAAPDTIKIVEEILEKKFASVLSVDFAQIGGVDFIAEVINSMDRSNEKHIFDELSKRDAKLADDIRKRMFVFEDVTQLDPRAIQKVIPLINNHDLVLALKAANKDVSDIFFSNMSSRQQETVRSDLEVTFNVRMRDVEEAQQRIVAIIRRLEEEGEIIISKGGKDEIIA